jgi:antitoxin YefM
MTCASYTDVRQNLARYMDEAVDSRAPIVVTRQGGRGNVVLISEEEFEGWRETVHLLSSPRNAARLMRSIRQIEAGSGREHTLI